MCNNGNKNILEILKKEIKQKIIIENDVNCASIGFYHQYSHYQNSALIYQPAVDYVGCGMIIQGKFKKVIEFIIEYF